MPVTSKGSFLSQKCIWPCEYAFSQKKKSWICIICLAVSICRYILFYCASLNCTLQILSFFFTNWKFVATWSLASLSLPFFHIVSLCHTLVIFPVFQTFSLLLYLLWWPVIFDVTIVIVSECHEPHSHEMKTRFTDAVCVLTAPLTWLFPHLSFFPWASLFPETQ